MSKKELEEVYEEEDLEEEEEIEEYEEDDEEEDEEDVESGDMIDDEIKAICRDMRKCKRTSQEYMVLSQRLSDLTDSKRNMDESIKERKQAQQIDNQKYAWIIPTVCQTLGNVAGQVLAQSLNRRTVNDVLYYEHDGNIVASRSTGFIQKPRI